MKAVITSLQAIILLDVDGVLNAVTSDPPEHFTDWKSTRVPAGFRITHSQTMADRLMALPARIVWLTTWCIRDLANTQICPLFGWNPLPTIPRQRELAESGWWKSDAAQKYLAENPGPFIWIDDDLDDAERMGEIAWTKTYPHLHMLVSPDTREGITPDQLDAMESFLNQSLDLSPGST